MTSRFTTLENYLTEKVPMTDTELDRITSLASITVLHRKARLLESGKVWTCRAFVGKGLLRTYRIDEKGTEHTTRFAAENWWVGDGESYISGQPSVWHIEAIEPSEIILWKKEDFELLIGEIPALKKVSEMLMSRSLIANQHRIFLSNSQTAEEKYNHFVSAYPEFSRRVPLHMIASYLGVTRETLSRIRKQATLH